MVLWLCFCISEWKLLDRDGREQQHQQLGTQDRIKTAAICRWKMMRCSIIISDINCKMVNKLCMERGFVGQMGFLTIIMSHDNKYIRKVPRTGLKIPCACDRETTKQNSPSHPYLTIVLSKFSVAISEVTRKVF